MLRRYWPQLVIIAAAGAFCWPVFAGRIMSPADMLLLWLPWKHALAGQFPEIHRPHNPMFDPIQQYLPWRIYATESLRAGLVPLWNPYQFMGTPFLANLQSTLLYPPSALFLITGAAHGFGVSAIAHLSIGGLLMFALLRTLNLRVPAALLGALVFMFNGFTVTWLCFPTLSLWTLMWLPGILLSYERATRQPLSVWPALCALLLGVQFLGGHLQISAYLVMALGVWAMVRAISQRRPGLVALALIPIGVGVALAAGQILPTLELAHYSGRASHGLAGALKTAFPVTHLVLYLVPNFFGNPVAYNYWGNFRDPSAFNFFETACYVGVLPLVLAVWSLRRWREPTFWCFAALVGFALLAATGTPVYSLLYYLAPGFKELAGLGRVLCLAAFGLAGLAAMGLDSLLAKGREARLGRAAVVFAAVAVTVVIVSWYVFGPAMGEMPDFGGYFTRQLLAFAGLLGAAVGLVLLCGRLSPTRLAWLASILVVVDLFGFGIRFNPFVDARLAFPETESIRWLKEHAGHDRVTSLASAEGKIDWFPHNAAMVYGLRDIHGSDSLRVRSAFELVSPPGGNQAQYPEPDSALMDELGVRYLMTHRALSGKWRLVYEGETRIYENAEARPRARLVGVAEGGGFVGERRNAGPAAAGMPNGTDIPALQPLRDDVAFVRDEAGDLSLEVSGVESGEGLVVVDSYFPGWQARVDGKLRAIRATEQGFREVEVPPGNHTVEFCYEPATYRVGLFVSLFAWAGLAAFGVACLSSSRSRAAARA